MPLICRTKLPNGIDIYTIDLMHALLRNLLRFVEVLVDFDGFLRSSYFSGGHAHLMTYFNRKDVLLNASSFSFRVVKKYYS